MGFFGFGVKDVHKALNQTAPGVRWQVACFGDEPKSGVWFAALHRQDRALFPSLSFEQAGILAPDIWGNLLALRAKVNSIDIWIESDDGRWVGTHGENGERQTRDSIPACFT